MRGALHSQGPSVVSAHAVATLAPTSPSTPQPMTQPKIRDRAHVVAAAVSLVAVGMAYSLAWERVAHHTGGWSTPADLWATFRAAHLVGWGGEGLLYGSGTGLVTLPGIAVVLAPVAMVSGALHLSESFPLALAHPTAWLLVGPVEMALGAVLLFPLDDLARRIGVPSRRRVVLVWLEAALVWPVVVLWGHPEDPLALACALYGLMAALDGRWRRGAVLFAVAVAVQPLTVLLLPIVAAYVPPRAWPRAGAIVAAPSALLLVAPLAHAWGATTHALLDQPNFPTIDHGTPWAALAPVLGRAAGAGAHGAHGAQGAHGVAAGTLGAHGALAVAAGPGRMLALAGAVLIGLLVARRRPPEATVVWLAALALSLRCVFEAVVDPYYLLPGLAVSLVVAARLGRAQLAVGVALAAAATALSCRHAGPWAYYLPMAALLLATWAVGWPRLRLERPRLAAVGERDAPRVWDAVPGGAAVDLHGPGRAPRVGPGAAVTRGR